MFLKLTKGKTQSSNTVWISFFKNKWTSNGNSQKKSKIKELSGCCYCRFAVKGMISRFTSSKNFLFQNLVLYMSNPNSFFTLKGLLLISPNA